MAIDEFEFRPITADEKDEYQRVARYVFADAWEDPDQDAEAGDNRPDGSLPPEWTQVAVHKGKIVASSGAHRFRMRMNGREVLADGVTEVGTYPGYRRRGLVRRLITDLLRRAHDNGQPTSILYASMGAIYQRFGYGRGATQVRYRFDPRQFRFQFGDRASGYTRMLDPETAKPVIKGLYDRFREQRNLLLQRSDLMWDLTFRGKKPPWCAVHYGDDGEPAGYVVYRTAIKEDLSELGLDQEITVTDLVWLDANAYRGLWDFVVSHDLVGRVLWWSVPEDDPAPELLLEPRILGRLTFDGLWLRVVDAAAVLAQRGYDTAGHATVEIAGDADCPWNEGVWRLETDAEEASVAAAGNGAAADLRTDPRGFASLVSGHTSATQLVRFGRAETGDTRRLPALDALFATRYRPACMDSF